MGRQPKSTAKSSVGVGSLFVAQADGSIAKDKDPQPASNPFKKKPRLQWLRLINAFCYALSALIVLSSIHTSSNDDYEDVEAWMGKQTLLSVAPYTQYIWYALYFLQGLYIAASYMPSLWSSELLGYTALNDKTIFKEAFHKSLPVTHYAPLCSSTALSVYSYFKWNIMTLAFASSCASTFFLVRIIKYQLDTVTVTAVGAAINKMKRWFQRRRATDNAPDENTLNEYLNDGADVTNQIQHYIFLKLPFELYAGYNLAWSVSLYNIIVCKLFGSVVLSELLTFVSLMALVGAGCYITWTEKKGLCYGVGVGMAWYLVGIFSQLVYLSFPIMYSYSDAAIAATKYMSIIFANILISTIVLRAVKNVLNASNSEFDWVCTCCCKV